MEKKLAYYIQQHQLIDDSDRVLVAASAGVDSSVLCHLFKKLNIDFGIAHCNFRLRGNESEADEIFIKKLAAQLCVPCYTVFFDTVQYAKTHNQSVQLAARELRYEWLWKICEEHGYQKLVTAHHLDDNIETVVFNFTKGTGIKGMRGILPKRDGLIRPMLFASKAEVMAYAETNKIAFREDSSNTTDKYTRNKIRHQVTPILESINPAFQHSAGDTIQHLREVEKLYEYALQQLRDKLLVQHKDRFGNLLQWQIDIQLLLHSPAPATVLYELIQPFGFNNSHTDQILQSIDNQPGSYFYSPDFRLLVDRTHLIIEEKKEVDESYQIEYLNGQTSIDLSDGTLVLKQLESIPTVFLKNERIAFFDLSKLHWPLTIRRWLPGDSFQPLGMHGQQKKLQDFFSNKKLSRSEKEKVWIIESGGDICWIVGMRLDDRFKVTSETGHYLVVEFLPSTFV